ncbi:MAG TPA: hypothetical protein VK947_04740 [Planococcus sp. (in: firmicutes)]|nr:hypothetical protein [Planococcus sp. (in: firmicutes)]
MQKNWLLLSVLPLLSLAACGINENSDEGNANLSDFQVSNPQAEATEGDFIYRLVSEKEQYEQGEPISMYAELEYTGEKDSVAIYHAASPFYFPMHEATRDYRIDYPMNEPLLRTEITKGEPLREDYVASGGYSAEEDEDYVEFMQSIISGNFPPGYYEVDGYANFYIEHNDTSQETYQISAQIDFKVVE